MIRFFKSLQPATLIIIPFIVFTFWIRTIFQSMPVSDLKTLPVWQALLYFLTALPSWINFILLFGLISAEAIFFNLILNKFEVHYKNTFLPAFVFALLISSTPAFMQFHPVHLINLILLFIIERVLTLFKNEIPVSALFDCGFLAGTASLIYFPAVILIPFLLATLFVLRPFGLKEWLITLIGLFLPYFFISTYMFWNHELISFWKSYLSFFQKTNAQLIIENNLKILVLAVSISVLLILSLFKMRMNYRKNIIRTRSFQQVFFILLLLSAAWLILVENIQIIHFAFLIIPVSVFCSYYFVSAKKGKLIYEYVLWLLIAIIVWNNFG